MSSKRTNDVLKASSKTSDKQYSNPLLFLNDFLDFNHLILPRDRSHSSNDTTSNSSSSFIDSDTRDRIYAQLHFTSKLSQQDDDTSTSTSGHSDDFIIIDSSPVAKQPRRKSQSTKSDSGQHNSDDDVIILDLSPVAKQIKVNESEVKIKRKRKKKQKESNKKKKKKSTDMELNSSCEEDIDDVDSATPLNVINKIVGGKIPEKMDPNDPWYLVEKDLLGREKYDQLYSFQRYNSRNVKCNNCRQKGHTTSTCPHTKRHSACYLCGDITHLISRCPESRCQYCFQLTHRGRPCQRHLANPHNNCLRCYMYGHGEKVCPEVWRQFHNTTGSDNKLVHLKNQRQDKAIYCFNCAEAGHFGHECSKNRPRGYPLPLFPYIARYDDSAYPQKRKNSVNLPSPHKRRSSCVAVLTTDKEHRQEYSSQKNRLLERKVSGSSSSSRRSFYDNSSKLKSFDNDHHRRMSSPQQSLLGPRPDLSPGRSHSTPNGPRTITRTHTPGRSLSFEHVRTPEDILYRQPPPRGERQELMERRRESYHHPYHETHFPRTPLHGALPPSPPFPFPNDMSTPFPSYSPPHFSREDRHFIRRERQHSGTHYSEDFAYSSLNQRSYYDHTHYRDKRNSSHRHRK